MSLLSCTFSRKRDDCLWVIDIGDIVFAFEPTLLAPMHDAVMWRRTLERDWLHHATTALESIARKFVDMFAPEAARAVIGVTAPDHLRAAFFTDEIFYFALKFRCIHYCTVTETGCCVD